MTTNDHLLDAFLVAAAQAGERDKLEALVSRWHRRLLAHAARLLGDRELAGDAVQDAWGEIIRSLSDLRDPVAFHAWAFRIVTRSCARLIRQHRNRRALAQVFTSDARVDGLTPEDTTIISLDTERVRTALRALSADQRAAIGLFYFEQMTVAQVAVALDAPVGTIKTRLMHARCKLRNLLEGEFNDPRD